MIWSEKSRVRLTARRQSAWAGTFYQKDPEKLRAEIDALVASAKEYTLLGNVRGVLSPVAGYAYSGRAAAAAFCALKSNPMIKRVVLTANSPAGVFNGVALSDHEFFETPLGVVPIHREACARLALNPLFQGLSDAHNKEHRIEVQLPFVQRVLGPVPVVPLLVGDVNEKDVVDITSTLEEVFTEDDAWMVCTPLSTTYMDFPREDPGFRKAPKAFTYSLDQEALAFVTNLDHKGFRRYCEVRNRSMLRSEAIEIVLGLLRKSCYGVVLDHYGSSYVNAASEPQWQSYASVAFVKRATAESAGVTFISHSSKDKGFAEKLARDLRQSGLGVWLDKWEMKPGDSLTDKIQDAIGESAYLVVLLSQASAVSPWVSKELNAALTRELELKRVYVIPALIEDCQIPEFLTDKMYADFRIDYRVGYDSLVARLSEKAGIIKAKL